MPLYELEWFDVREHKSATSTPPTLDAMTKLLRILFTLSGMDVTRIRIKDRTATLMWSQSEELP